VPKPKKVLVVGGGPSGLEFARVAAARGHAVVVHEKEEEIGGHVRLQSLLPDRDEFFTIARWLARQAQKNGAMIRTESPVDEGNLDALLDEVRPDHVVVATGARVCVDGFQGWTAAALPGWDTAYCVGWDEIVTGSALARGEVLVVDDLSTAVAPLTAVKLRLDGVAVVRLVTRWPMVAMETMYDVYHDWIMPKVFDLGVEIIPHHFIKEIRGNDAIVYNVHSAHQERTLRADTIVMVTGRQSVNGLHDAVRARGVPVETIGDANAPRGTYEAVFEGHRAGRKV
jgi:thioredoxin reductase